MKELGYSRPTLYRYLKILKEAGFLMSTRNAAVTLGPKVVELDYLTRRSDPLVQSAQPHLKALGRRDPGGWELDVGKLAGRHTLSLAHSPADRNHAGVENSAGCAAEGDPGRLPFAEPRHRVLAEVGHDQPAATIDQGHDGLADVRVSTFAQL